MVQVTDFLIIGGGIAGLGAAAHIAPHAKVHVLEQEDSLGYHSSGRSAAIFIKNYGNATLRQLNAISEPSFIEPTGISDKSLLSPRGELLIATEDELAHLNSYLEGADGMFSISSNDALDLVPILRKEKIAAAAYEENAKDLDSDLLLQGYTKIIKQHGGKTTTKSQVCNMTYENGLWTAKTNSDVFKAPIVINAAGAWADQIANLAHSQSIGLIPKRRSIAVIPQIEGYDTESWPVFASAAENWYAKPGSGKMLVSPADEDPVEPHDAWVDDMVLAEGLYRYEQMVTEPVTHVEHSWAGLRNFVPDKTPVVGFASDVEGFFWLAGQGGYGIQTAPALSQLTADLCLGMDSNFTTETIQALSPQRLFLSGH